MPYKNKDEERACQRRWYQKNAPSQRLRLKRNRAAQVLKNFGMLRAYLLGHPCVDCGEGDLAVLDFDHVRGDKAGHVPVMCSGGLSWATITREIEKCEVRCANCHRRKTAGQFAWFRKVQGACSSTDKSGTLRTFRQVVQFHSGPPLPGHGPKDQGVALRRLRSRFNSWWPDHWLEVYVSWVPRAARRGDVADGAIDSRTPTRFARWSPTGEEPGCLPGPGGFDSRPPRHRYDVLGEL